MGKVSLVSSKYIINGSINIEGTVERPDVIGAIFGQTEGLLGSELELRELQRSGKVGRIEVNLSSNNGKTSGLIIIPTSLDQAETAIIAASLETIERIGPCNSIIRINKIEDVRITKRDFVIERAKELLRNFHSTVIPDSTELTAEVSQGVRMMEITTWGPEKLPAGPGVEESEEVILVEGRADVLNLLKSGFKNSVSLNGTSIPESIKDLCKRKTITVFVDGDRGGDLIVKELMEIANIDFVTKAPDGKELEELTKKEIHLALRAKVAAAQFKFEGAPRRIQKTYERNSPKPTQIYEKKESPRDTRKPYTKKINLTSEEKNRFKEMLNDLIGTRGAYLLDKEHNVLGKVPTSELEDTLKDLRNVDAVIFDGPVTKDIGRIADRSRIKFLIGMDSSITSSDTRATVLVNSDL
ncbi:DNA primase [Candidatus Woesearchaeota archaeon]|nr:DNA primase [Candidatus Woesearchaeota archaeon]